MGDKIGELTQTGMLGKLVPCPAGKNVVGSTWVLKKKCNAENKVVKHKSRLCTQGFLQKPSINYHETAAPTIQKLSLHYILSLAAKHDLKIHQIDVKKCLSEWLTQ
jgi:hypothetical protein